MKHQTFATVGFDVGHTSDHPSYCQRPHGHHVVLVVGCYGVPMKDWGSYVVDVQVLQNDLDRLQGELELRPLNDMIAPANPTAAGLAQWVWERLSMHYPTLSYVQVDMGGLSHIIERD